MSLSAKRESRFLSNCPAGTHVFRISDVRSFKKHNGELILDNNDNPGVIVTFTADQGTQEELYWIEGAGYPRLLKLLRDIGVEKDGDIQKKDMIGKMLWGKIKEQRVARMEEIIKVERRLTETAPFAELNPFKDDDCIEYKPETFYPEDKAF